MKSHLAMNLWHGLRLCLVGLLIGSGPARADAPANDLERRVDAAFFATFPLYEMARARYNAVVNPLNPRPLVPNGAPINRRALMDHTAREITTPNNDTLYSASWLDLHSSPVRIQVPRVDAGRYWSIALLDIFTNNFAVVGSRQDGTGPVEVVIAGPDWQGPMPEGRVVRAPSNDVQLLGRFLVTGREDAVTVHRFQDGLRISALDVGAPLLPQWVPVTKSGDPENFLAVVNEMLSRNPVRGKLAELFGSWSDLGIGGGRFAFARVGGEVQAAWKRRLPVLHDQLREGLQRDARIVDGWSVPSPAVGDFGDNDRLRAAIAFGGLGALTSNEAIYLNLEQEPGGASLDGRRRYRLVVPKIEAGAFWSLSVYEKSTDGRLFFTDNPIGRYAIGNRTEGVVRRADGSMELQLQHEAPADTRNWLPTPAGSMAITLRAYLPSVAMREGRAPLPRLILADPESAASRMPGR